MVKLEQILRAANLWAPERGWTDALVIGRDILEAPSLRSRWESGEIYLNPGRDAGSARSADAFLDLELTRNLHDMSPKDRARAEFIRDCIRQRSGWCKDPVVVKVLLFDDRIEVFVGDTVHLWPSPLTTSWPNDWTFYRMERYVRWENEPFSAGRYWTDDQRGPCPDGQWPVYHRPLLGCVCCTNGLLMPIFGKGKWICWPPMRQYLLSLGNLVVESVLPKLPAPRVIAGVKDFPFNVDIWGEYKTGRLAKELLKTRRILKVPAELVLQSLVGELPLEEQLVAEEVAGSMAQAIIDEARKTVPEPTGDKNMGMYDTFVADKGYTADFQRCITETVDKLQQTNTDFQKPGMLLGKIQSGKTRAFIGIMALAFDRGYDVAIVLTKGTIALAEQTTQRLRKEFERFVEADKVKVYDIMQMPTALGGFQLKQKLVFVVKKEDDNLRELEKLFFDANPSLAEKRLLIVDDEADFASIGFRKEKSDITYNKLAQMVSNFRARIKGACSFLQVTATPYSLYLQPEEIEVGGTVYQPMQPAFTTILPVHSEYVGGDFYFPGSSSAGMRPDIAPLAGHVHVEMPDVEFTILGKRDARYLRNILTTPNLAVLRSAILNFIMAGIIRQHQIGESRQYKCAMIVHTETSKEKHAWQQDLVTSLLKELHAWALDPAKRGQLDALLGSAYDNLEISVNAAGLSVPTKASALQNASAAIRDGYVVAKKVNSEEETSTLLDTRGQLRLDDPFNVFVGGQILDRGLTIDNLIAFVYGRNPQKFQQNTVMQHSRMFGARSVEDLAVTRFYTSARIQIAMRKMNEFDSALREAFERGGHEEGIAFIQKDSKGRIIPCSPNHVMISNTVTLKPGGRQLPVGFQTICASRLYPLMQEIDGLIQGLPGYNVGAPFWTDLASAKEILGKIRETYEYAERHENTDYEWDVRTYRAILDYVNSLVADSNPEKNKVYVLVGTDRDIARRSIESGQFANNPDSGKTDAEPARAAAKDVPCLILLRQNGSEDKGWRGAPFWWPVVILPQNMQTAVFSEKTLKDSSEDGE